MKLHDTYADRGLAITAIHVKKKLDRGQVRQYVRKHKIPYAIGLDKSGELSAAYEVRTIPHMFLVDGEGRIVWDGREITAATERAIEGALPSEG